MSYETLRTSISNILGGAELDTQIAALLEMEDRGGPPKVSKRGWWPSKNSRVGEPMSDELWGELMRMLLNLSDRKVPHATALRRVAGQWGVKIDLVKEFLKQTSLMGALESGTLDLDMILNVFDGSKRGSGIWTVGDATTMLRKPYSGRAPRAQH